MTRGNDKYTKEALEIFYSKRLFLVPEEGSEEEIQNVQYYLCRQPKAAEWRSA